MRSCALLLVAACSTSTTPPTNTKPTPDPVTLAVVMSGWEIWIGNDKDPRVAADAPERTPGALDRVIAAFGKADLAHTAPDARAVLVTYGVGAKVRVPLGPVANLTPAAFGTQQDYHGGIGVDLLQGLDLAAQQLEAVPGRHVLIVLGDGTDTNPEAARAQLPKLRERLEKLPVEVTAIVYRTQMSQERDFIDTLTKHVTRAATLDEFQTALAGTLATVR